MGKPKICIGENKDADQLRGNRVADQRHCFRYSDSTIPLLLKSEISSCWLFSVLVQVGLCRTCSQTTLLVFPRGGSFHIHSLNLTMITLILSLSSLNAMKQSKHIYTNVYLFFYLNFARLNTCIDIKNTAVFSLKRQSKVTLSCQHY